MNRNHLCVLIICLTYLSSISGMYEHVKVTFSNLSADIIPFQVDEDTQAHANTPPEQGQIGPKDSYTFQRQTLEYKVIHFKVNGKNYEVHIPQIGSEPFAITLKEKILTYGQWPCIITARDTVRGTLEVPTKRDLLIEVNMLNQISLVAKKLN